MHRKRPKRHLLLVITGVLISAFTSPLMAAPALASTPTSTSDTSGAFPVIPNAPAWYSTSQPAPYSTDGYQRASDQAVDDSVWFEEVLYFMPTGRASESTDGSLSPDIRVTTFTTGHLFGAARRVDPEALVLSISEPFQKMAAGIGTTLTTGIVLPADPNSTDVNAASPTVRFLGHGMVQVRRPGFPSSCDAIDPVNFIIQTAMLGENSYKYAVELNVTFGDREVLRNQVCGSKVKGAITKGESAVSAKVKQTEKDTKTKIADDKSKVKSDVAAAQSKAKEKKSEVALSGLIAIVVCALSIAAVLLGVTLVKKFRPSTGYYDDGRPVNPKGDSGPDELGHGNAKQSAPRKSGYGR